MADVFISYSRDDRALAEGLARLLSSAGYSVWWDRELGAGDEFSRVIEHELACAGCVVVLWTEASIKSMFVRDEAGRAAAAGKIVPVRTPDLSISRLPVGFGAYHTLLLSERDELCRVVAKATGRGWAKPEEGALVGWTRRTSRFYYAHKWPLLATLLAVLASGLMWLAFLRDREPLCDGVPVREISSSLWNNIQLSYFDNAEQRAKLLLACDPASVSALSGLGAIGFYRSDYEAARSWFEKALAARPGDFVLTLNLADAEVELGKFEAAIGRYSSIDNGSTAVRYKRARAELLSGHAEKARSLVAQVPTTFAEEARAGKARLIAAAALVQLAEGRAQAERDSLLGEAKGHFMECVRQDPAYWRGILTGEVRNVQEPFSGVVAKLGRFAKLWLADMSAN